VPTYLGRVAIALLPRLWNLKPGDEVLAPAYNCGSEIDPFVHAGLRVVLYRVNRDARIDTEDIRHRTTDRTRVVYVTHYFGWAQDLSDLSSWCQKRGLLLVEDCALSLFSNGPEGPLGLQGDAAVFSLRKGLPVPDGGALTLRKPPPESLSRRVPPPWTTTTRAMLPLFKRRYLRTTEHLGLYSWFRIGLEHLRQPLPTCQEQHHVMPEMPTQYYFRDTTAHWGLSKITAGLLRAIDPRFVRDRRRENYLRLRDDLDGILSLEFLYSDLPDGVCPLSMPVLVTAHRSLLVAELNRCGIAAFPFWEGYHRGLSWDDFPEARYLKDHLLALPVNEALDHRHMAFIARTLRDRLCALGLDATPASRSTGRYSDKQPQSTAHELLQS
jgi:dTDP-4-amino-4,6-dideoxygalactose transaminase